MIAAATGIPPSVLWEQSPEDLATLIAVLNDQARKVRR